MDKLGSVNPYLPGVIEILSLQDKEKTWIFNQMASKLVNLNLLIDDQIGAFYKLIHLKK